MTETRYDYKTALREFNHEQKIKIYHGHGGMSDESREHIRRALLIADRLQQEPSEAMDIALSEELRKPAGQVPSCTRSERHMWCYRGYKAMTTQMLKEIDMELGE